MAVKTHLTLGRVSNLPTVWSNVLAAGAIAGATSPLSGWLSMLVAMSLFYIGGMYDNDVCDSRHDAVKQPHRPIPAGLISRNIVARFAAGFFVTGLLLVFISQHLTSRLPGYSMASGNARLQDAANIPDATNHLWFGLFSLFGLFSGLCLLACIFTYNRHHKNNRYSPLLMAACRVGVLLTTSLTLGQSLTGMLWIALFAMLCWLIGLTYFAKYEQKSLDSIKAAKSLDSIKAAWPLGLLLLPIATGLVLSVSSPVTLLPTCALLAALCTAYQRLTSDSPKAKGSAIALLIASISLLDGVFLSYYWGIGGTALSLLAFLLTLALQKHIAGT